MGGSMMGGGMIICAIASTLFALIVTIVVIIQTVLQSKILAELREHDKQLVAPPARQPAAAPTRMAERG